MLAVFLLIPFLLIRFPLLSHFGKNALSRAAYFAPVQGKEKIAYMIYQLSKSSLVHNFLFSLKSTFILLFSFMLEWLFTCLVWLCVLSV